jgi:hypothetical protein
MLTGTFNQLELNEILRMIEVSCKVTVEKENNQITIK